MNKVKQALKDFFPRLFAKCRLYGDEYPSTQLSKNLENQILIVSECPEEKNYYYWRPVEKDIVTDFTYIEKKYNIKIHQDVKDYYNSYWCYSIKGLLIGENKATITGRLPIRLNQVLPGKEILNLQQAIEMYLESTSHNYARYEDGLRNFITNNTITPIAMNFNKLIVVDNITAEIYLIDYENKFIKIAENIAGMIDRIKPYI